MQMRKRPITILGWLLAAASIGYLLWGTAGAMGYWAVVWRRRLVCRWMCQPVLSAATMFFTRRTLKLLRRTPKILDNLITLPC